MILGRIIIFFKVALLLENNGMVYILICSLSSFNFSELVIFTYTVRPSIVNFFIVQGHVSSNLACLQKMGMISYTAVYMRPKSITCSDADLGPKLVIFPRTDDGTQDIFVSIKGMTCNVERHGRQLR